MQLGAKTLSLFAGQRLTNALCKESGSDLKGSPR